MATIKEVIKQLEALAPPALQESYDNAQLITGSPDMFVTGILTTLDCTKEVVREAMAMGCNMVVAHHPIVFKGLKSFTGRDYVEKTIIKAIKEDIAIYAIHTNLDNVIHGGVNATLAQKLDLQNVKVLSPKQGRLQKLTVMVPQADTQTLLSALYEAGAGHIGNYSNCSFRTSGTGTFTGNKESRPAIGQLGQPEEVQENSIEVILPDYAATRVLTAMRQAHPYEEVAYFLTSLENTWQEIGSGAIGELKEDLSVEAFLHKIKNDLPVNTIRYTATDRKTIKRVAVCGGSGSFLIKKALQAGADAFITADVKYHEFFDAQNSMIVADIGHFESETHVRELLKTYLQQKFSNIAIYASQQLTNPINYF